VPDTSRRPILHAILSGSWRPAVGTVITAAVSFGLVNAGQATALDNLAAAVATLLTALTSTVHAFGVLRASEGHTTPTVDPRDRDGTSLVRPVASGGGRHEATDILPVPDRD
jgi:hypothetical protein